MALLPDNLLAAIPPGLMERAMELVSIPAAHLLRGPDGFRVVACNMTFREAGFACADGVSPPPPSLAAHVALFMASRELRQEFDWASGDTVHARFYRVTAARTGADVADRCTLSLVDYTAQERTERSLRREMTTDSLTGLPNREGFGDLVDAVDDRRDRHAVLVVDLARFGRINACLGSLAGDELLISVARRIKGALRARDTLARIGGDEFGILMEIDEDRVEAEHVARRIERALLTPFRLSDYQIRVDCSVGVAFGGDQVDDGEELIRHAQFAVKRAKETGRTEVYQAKAFTVARQEFAMETRLRRAVENGQLRHEYQPICDLGTGRVVAFEALARWRDEDGRDVPPSEFIPVAEESGLIVPLGRWAIEEATRTLAEWDRDANGDCGVQVAVNLSPIQLARDHVVGVVERALEASCLPGRRLKLELTESALVADPDRTAGTMRALKDLGATIAMDDFGTGYSNLAYLQRLPIDILKIDRSFVTGMLADRDKVAIVRAVLGLAQALGMRTVAEGVETPELAQTLAALGCAMGQGFLYSRPVPAEMAYRLIASPTA
ncbi:putative bifunctional diguanylate cyclase/phosphodiesterase [Sphingomonas lenta]|uniref:GGDEF-domain containing protein n=1 Tax=Sphingomonas lenta TaxID=1141887 RepID=A0A2A2SBL1_9SPHN|nr:bifunctional diguanylate cyclase/phosphodiesterase [Sphingomonas lenta]PAX06570.1 GGDEF-domain containing protein [Sphingomonas lenta]